MTGPVGQTIARRQSPDKLERYWTHSWQTRALFERGALRFPNWSDLRVIEPCAGAGWMRDVIGEYVGHRNVAAFDIEPAAEGITQADTLRPGFFEALAQTTDLSRCALITNPPFSQAAAYWRRGQLFALTALLVRVTWLEATKDREDIPDPDRVIVLPRTKFGGPAAGQSSDSATAAWMIWGDVTPGVTRVTRSQIDALKQPRPELVSA